MLLLLLLYLIKVMLLLLLLLLVVVMLLMALLVLLVLVMMMVLLWLMLLLLLLVVALAVLFLLLLLLLLLLFVVLLGLFMTQLKLQLFPLLFLNRFTGKLPKVLHFTNNDPLHFGHIVDFLKRGKVKFHLTHRFVIRVVPYSKVRMFQCFLSRDPFKRIKRQHLLQ